VATLAPLVNARDEDPRVRLGAAVALAASGGPATADALLAMLDDPEADRASVLTALSGVAARHGTRALSDALSRELEVVAGAERDAVLEAFARVSDPAVLPELERLARGDDDGDRKAVATLTAAHPGPASVALALHLLDDADPQVRAQAAWSLGTIGDTKAWPALVRATKAGPGVADELSVNAVGALARIAARAKRPDMAADALCPLLTDRRAAVRVDVLTGLALSRARCGDGSRERAIVRMDPDDRVRAAAALTLRRRPLGREDATALDRCASQDASPLASRRCREAPPIPARVEPVLVYVVPDGAMAPVPGASYLLSFADGLVRAGVADRRGAVFEPAAPVGDVALERVP
jgi:HEAT repeat protein